MMVRETNSNKSSYELYRLCPWAELFSFMDSITIFCVARPPAHMHAIHPPSTVLGHTSHRGYILIKESYS